MILREEWRPIPGHAGYEVSDLGRVRSVDRYVNRGPSRRHPAGFARLYKGRALRPGRSRSGYLSVVIRERTYPVQHLVALAFIGPRPAGRYVLHNDGRHDNNAATNLRYGTPKENSADAALHGTRARGTDYASAKLDDWTASVIRALRGIETQAALAMLFDVSASAVQAIHDGRTWKHVAAISPTTAREWLYAFGPAGMDYPTEEGLAA